MGSHLNRRQFMLTVATAAAVTAATPRTRAQTESVSSRPAGGKPRLIWGNLLHLSYNMWLDHDLPNYKYPSRQAWLLIAASWDSKASRITRIHAICAGVHDGAVHS
jgi:hypothetical protein